MLDTVRGYAAVAAGLAEAGARAAWESVTSRPGDDETTGSSAGLPRQVQDTVDGVLASSRQNSELLVGLVRTEVERAVGRLGFVREGVMREFLHRDGQRFDMVFYGLLAREWEAGAGRG